MEICHPHNLNEDLTRDKPFGIRVSLPAGDSFLGVIGADWHRDHWFASQRERNKALKDMREEHLYSRPGDRPRLLFAAIDPDGTEAD